MGKGLIIVGILLTVTGLLLVYAPGLINWFGKLPGDLHIKNENGRIFIPITSMILISVILTVLINIFLRE
ncbi:MAG: DUF2905 domain-containing protein [Thiotrichales bacterium]|nr:DUF2905 domain-containing protein [Thiotrichales bacterium]